MNEEAVRDLIARVQAGEVDADEAVRLLRELPFASMGEAVIDHHRELRQGFAEAVYAPGKTVEHCVAIVGELLAAGSSPVVLSRASSRQVAAVVASHPGASVTETAGAGRERLATVVWRPAPPRPESVLVVTAGTSDLPVAEECVATLAAFGFKAPLLADVGVAGLHRLLAHLSALLEADAVVVVAGMEGALASVVGGITPAPVVAVPTSAGYGSSLGGLTALLGMLASCASGLCVVGIDNGFGAAYAVARSLRRRK